MKYVPVKEINLEEEARTIKNEERLYRQVCFLTKPIANQVLKPLILNRKNLVGRNNTVIYAPNHRRTVDSIMLFNNIPDEIHFVALKRFFTGEDSIFNNNKNKLLRDFTAWLFNGIGLIPVVRPQDKEHYPNESNKYQLLILKRYLELGKSVGIYPEGTTNKTLETELLDIDTTAFSLAKKMDGYVQPISIVYRPKDNPCKYKGIVNIRPAFKVENDIKEGAEQWKRSVLEGIEENNAIFDAAALKQKVKIMKRR